jgi:4-hydroxybenzoate polyprenyltransferase
VAALALAAAILFYDWHHKQNPLSPVVMGLCRLLVYVVAACAVAPGLPAQVAWGGLMLLCYLVGLTYVARQEHLGRVRSLWPLAFIAVPAAWAVAQAVAEPRVAVLTVAWLGWVAFALSHLRRRGPGDVPRAVGHLLAGICLWDAVVIAATGATAAAALAVAGFVSTLVLQRYVSPT